MSRTALYFSALKPRLGAGLMLALSSSLMAAAPDNAPDGYVSRKEYDALKKQMAAMQARMDALDSTAPKERSRSSGSSNSSAVAALQQEVSDIRATVEETKPGTNKFLITGNASAGFSSLNNSSSNFGATFSPIFLWELSDKLMFESEVELELEDTDTVVNLEYANMSYELNDYMVLSAGKFLNPMNIFVERYEPKWINKLPDTPLAIYDGILPESNVGAQIRGAVPLGPTKFNYALYVSNAPRLEAHDPEAAGQLIFDNFSSLSDNKAVGGRVGFLPLPWLEMGYGIQYSKVRAEDSNISDPTATLQSVDLSIRRDSPTLKGSFTLLGQYAWSNVSTRTYDADGADGFGPVTFSNRRDGGYVQLSYRPKQLSDLLNRCEFIVRGDMANTATGVPGGFDEKRMTLGVDYWLNSSTVLKAAYEFDSRNNGEPDNSGVLFQAAMGF